MSQGAESRAMTHIVSGAALSPAAAAALKQSPPPPPRLLPSIDMKLCAKLRQVFSCIAGRQRRGERGQKSRDLKVRRVTRARLKVERLRAARTPHRTTLPTLVGALSSVIVSLALISSLGAKYSDQQLFIKSSSQQQQQQQQQKTGPSRYMPVVSSSSLVPNFATSYHSPLSLQQQQQHQQTWRSQLQSTTDQEQPKQQQYDHSTEARGALTRNLYSRVARNASLIGGNSGAGSWHFPRISPDQAAEMLRTGAQVINRIAQADTPLNYCRTPDNQEGECSDIRKCIWLVLDKARLKQSVCLRNLIIPAVCCPLSSTNNTPIANMIQSTLEPVLFRPKSPKLKQKPLGGGGPVPLRPFSTGTTVNRTILAGPPPSPATLVIRQHNNNSNQLLQMTNSTTSTSSPVVIVGSSSHSPSTTSTSPAPPPPPLETSSSYKPLEFDAPIKGSSSSFASLFQDSPSDEQQVVVVQHGNHNGQYNRTVSRIYPWANETCGEGSRARTGRIVGGSDSKLGQWPWMTAMYLNKRTASSSPFASSLSSLSSSSNGAGEFWCGGALINRRFILTAAHCLSDQRGNRYRNDQVTIKLGGIDLVRHQAPADILRNGEIESRTGPHLLAPPGGGGGVNSNRRSGATSRAASDQQASGKILNQSQARWSDGDDEEEFSWTAFITKALGLVGGSGSSSSSSSSGGNSGTTTASSSHSSGGGGAQSTAAEGPMKAASDRKQQLAAHAKRTYFKEYKVASIKQHPNFKRHGFYNDIGLIELKSDVDYDELVSPICLPSEFDFKRDLSGYMATVLGWGTLSYGGQGSKMLQQVAMPIWNNKDCDDRYLQHIGKTFLCAGFLTGGKDACQGDSGGPLMVSDKSGRWTLHGVVSFGKTCAQAGYPGVYTRVTEYLDWIRDNTDLNGYASQSSVAAAGARAAPVKATAATGTILTV